MTAHLISRVTVLGTGLIGGSFALACKKYLTDVRISGWDRPEVLREARSVSAIDEAFAGELAPALRGADLVYIALPIGATLDLLKDIARHASSHALVTDACSTKYRIAQSAAELFPEPAGPLFLPAHPMAGKEISGIAQADADLFRNSTYALIGATRKFEPPDVVASLAARSFPTSASLNDPTLHDPRVSAFLKIIEKIGARPLWLGAEQHDYAVALSSHLPQLAAVALGSFLYDRLDENGLPITLAGPGLRDSLRLAGSSYSLWRDIILTNRDAISAALDLYARRLDELRERLNSRELESDFESANDLYKLLRSL
jgi:prephenate dehydrogenase